jgi:hypothetical protein
MGLSKLTSVCDSGCLHFFFCFRLFLPCLLSFPSSFFFFFFFFLLGFFSWPAHDFRVSVMKKLGLSNKGFSSSDFGRELRNYQESCSQVEEVAARGNKITQIPDELASFSSIHALRLNQNLITTVPSFFNKFSLLTGLDLSSNQIVEFPDVLCSLSLLHTLHLRNNRISQVSRRCVNLKQLAILSLMQNDSLGEFAQDCSTLAETQKLLLHLSTSDFPRSKVSLSPRRPIEVSPVTSPISSPRTVDASRAKQLADEQAVWGGGGKK